MMPPLNRTVVELVEETGISDVTLYAWRKQARARNPLRWSGEIRNWDNPKEVWLNPEREVNVATDRKSEAA